MKRHPGDDVGHALDAEPSSLPDWVTEATDVEDHEAREIYALAGLALYLAQVLEHGIVNCLVGVEMLGANRSGAAQRLEREIDQLWEDNFRLTLGKLVHRINSNVECADDLRINLEKSIEARNCLAHRFFREHAADFLTPEGRRLMADELKAMRDLFSSSDRQLDPIAYRLWKIVGITPELVERIVQLMRAGASDEDIDRAFEQSSTRSKD